MKRKAKKTKTNYSGEINLERILPYDPPVKLLENGWSGPYIKTITREELKKLYPNKLKNRK